MEFDVRPHEPYDATIAALFIALMLVVTVLLRHVLIWTTRKRKSTQQRSERLPLLAC